MPAVPRDKTLVGNWNRKVDIVENPTKWLPLDFDHDFPRPSSVIRYRSSRQLHKYNALLHQLQLLMLQRQVMRTVGQHAVSLLQQMDANDRLYSHAYRLTYSFLTTFGQHFPTIVSDITTETSKSERR